MQLHVCSALLSWRADAWAPLDGRELLGGGDRVDESR